MTATNHQSNNNMTQQTKPNTNTTKPRPEWDRILSASQRNNASEIENLILNENVSPSHSNSVGQSALHIAALWGNIDAVTTLLKYKANTNAQNRINGATPLHSAVQSMKKPIGNRTKCIQLIIDCDGYNESDEKCNPNMKDVFGFTALGCLQKMINGRFGNDNDHPSDSDLEELKAMEQVLVKGMASSEKTRHPIFTMIDKCNVESIQSFLEEYCGNASSSSSLSPTTTSLIDELKEIKTGMTPLHYAIENLFVDNGDNKTDVLKDDVTTIQAMKKVICLLIDYGSNINIDNQRNEKQIGLLSAMVPTVMDSSTDRMYDLCKILSSSLESSKDYNKGGNTIKTSLEGIILSLLSNGAIISSSTVQILHDGARRGNLQTVQFWIEKLGIDVNTRGRQGLTPLHFAARSGKMNVVKYILGLGTLDVNIMDDRGKTALDAAIVNDKDDVIEALQEYYSTNSKK